MAEQKTIGQKLYELINPCKAGDPIRPAMWDEVDEDYHAHYERAAAAFLNSEAAASEASLTHRPLPPSPEEEGK